MEGQLTAGSACTIDQSTDEVIPTTLTTTNTTSEFSSYTAQANDAPLTSLLSAIAPQVGRCE